jgi:hypothetical protein
LALPSFRIEDVWDRAYRSTRSSRLISPVNFHGSSKSMTRGDDHQDDTWRMLPVIKRQKYFPYCEAVMSKNDPMKHKIGNKSFLVSPKREQSNYVFHLLCSHSLNRRSPEKLRGKREKRAGSRKGAIHADWVTVI